MERASLSTGIGARALSGACDHQNAPLAGGVASAFLPCLMRRSTVSVLFSPGKRSRSRSATTSLGNRMVISLVCWETFDMPKSITPIGGEATHGVLCPTHGSYAQNGGSIGVSRQLWSVLSGRSSPAGSEDRPMSNMPKLSARATQALEVLSNGGHFSYALERNGYTGREQFKWHLRGKSGGNIRGFGHSTYHELNDLGFIGHGRPSGFTGSSTHYYLRTKD